MTLLARSRSLIARRQGPKPAPPPAVAIVENCVEAMISSTLVVATPKGALWIEGARALVVADLHLEKGSAFARAGQMLPPYDTRAALHALRALMDQYAPDIVVSLGDAFHDGGGPQRMNEPERAELTSLMERADWVWVEGNHEGKAAETLGGVARAELRLGDLVFRHEPMGATGEISGHLHPVACVAGRGRNVRRRCFAYDRERMVLPAFGAYAGGLNVRAQAFEQVFPSGAHALVLGRDRVLPVAAARLIGD